MITNYATLKTTVADHLERTDLTSVIPTFIQLAEDYFLFDPQHRVQKLVTRGEVLATATGTVTLPSDFASLDSWYHAGQTYFGPIEIVGADTIGSHLGRFGTTGVPKFAAIVNGVARLAPVPDGTYSTQLTYWQKITRLSDSNTTNWLLDEAPSIYLFATLHQAALYLKDPAQAAEWERQRDWLIEGYFGSEWNQEYGGTVRRQTKAIGG